MPPTDPTTSQTTVTSQQPQQFVQQPPQQPQQFVQQPMDMTAYYNYQKQLLELQQTPMMKLAQLLQYLMPYMNQNAQQQMQQNVSPYATQQAMTQMGLGAADQALVQGNYGQGSPLGRPNPNNPDGKALPLQQVLQAIQSTDATRKAYDQVRASQGAGTTMPADPTASMGNLDPWQRQAAMRHLMGIRDATGYTSATTTPVGGGPVQGVYDPTDKQFHRFGTPYVPQRG